MKNFPRLLAACLSVTAALFIAASCRPASPIDTSLPSSSSLTSSISSVPSASAAESTTSLSETTAETTAPLFTASSNSAPASTRPSSALPAVSATSVTSAVPTSPTVSPPPASTPEQILAAMSREEKVGQLFLIRCPASGTESVINTYHPGGILLFARDFQKRTPAQAKDVIAGYQRTSSLPLLIAVDEEGGTVNRVSRFPAYRSSPFLSPQQLYAKGGWALIENDTAEKAVLLKSLGINVNMAPVCDIARTPSDYIYPRTFGGTPTETAAYVERVVTAMNAAKIGSVLKHFPGYGGNADTHTGAARDDRELESFISGDFLPFAAGIRSGAGAVMVSHNTMVCLDPNAPASLSASVHVYLRQEMGYDGVIMTDDLAMAAVTSYADSGKAAVLAVKAGNDLLCVTDFQTQIPALLDAVKRGEITEAELDTHALRILRWKERLGLLKGIA